MYVHDYGSYTYIFILLQEDSKDVAVPLYEVRPDSRLSNDLDAKGSEEYITWVVKYVIHINTCFYVCTYVCTYIGTNLFF